MIPTRKGVAPLFFDHEGNLIDSAAFIFAPDWLDKHPRFFQDMESRWGRGIEDINIFWLRLFETAFSLGYAKGVIEATKWLGHDLSEVMDVPVEDGGR